MASCTEFLSTNARDAKAYLRRAGRRDRCPTSGCTESWILILRFCILSSVFRIQHSIAALLPAVLLLSDCSTDLTKGRLVGDTDINQGEAEKTNYPPNKLAERTFVFANPIAYESKRRATDEETKIALKVVRKLGPADDNQRLIAIPIAFAKGNSTTAEVMVYDNRKQTLVGESVYRLANTPASGQPLKLDEVTAVFVSPE
jgi:hypothetical protein